MIIPAQNLGHPYFCVESQFCFRVVDVATLLFRTDTGIMELLLVGTVVGTFCMVRKFGYGILPKIDTITLAMHPVTGRIYVKVYYHRWYDSRLTSCPRDNNIYHGRAESFFVCDRCRKNQLGLGPLLRLHKNAHSQNNSLLGLK